MKERKKLEKRKEECEKERKKKHHFKNTSLKTENKIGKKQNI